MNTVNDVYLNICHLYPDTLNLYGDRGNVICMEKRLAWRGIGVNIKQVPIGCELEWKDTDLFFIGGGQDFEQEVLLPDLEGKKADAIREAVEDGRVFLAICGGYQILGKYYTTHDGVTCSYIGAIDACTVGGAKRMIGNFMFRCAPEDGGFLVTGFENHSGRTYLGPGARPLGTVVRGFGNNGEDGGEGARYKNVFCSYSHGPLLPKNPGLCDRILELALRRRYPGFVLPELESGFEHRAASYMANRLGASPC